MPSSNLWPQGHPRRRQILLVLCLSLLVVVIDNTILNTALPTLARVLHAGTSSLQWIADAYTLCFAALLVPAGALGDRYGRRLSLVGGLAVFALGSAAAAFATGTGTLIAARVVMGLGAAFVMPATLSILNSVFPPRERPQAIAAWSAVAGVGIVIGPTLGGLLLTHFWWGSVFLVNVPLVAVALAGVLLLVPETAEPGRHRLDFTGTLMIAGALFLLVDAIIEAPARGWAGPVTLAEGAAGLAGLGLVHLVGAAHPEPADRPAGVRGPRLLGRGRLGNSDLLRPVRQPVRADPVPPAVHGYSPLSAGVRALPFAIAMAAVSPVSTILAGRLGSRVIIPAGIALMGAGLLDLSTAGVHTPYPPLAVAVAIMGAGMGLVMAPASTTIMTTVPAHQAGAGSAINDTIREVGGALGIAIIGSLAENVYRSKLGSTLAAAHLPPPVSHLATSSVAAADAVGRHLGGASGAQLTAAAHSAFTAAMSTGMRTAAVVALAAAIGAVFALPGAHPAGCRGRPPAGRRDGSPAGRDSHPAAGRRGHHHPGPVARRVRVRDHGSGAVLTAPDP